MKWTFTITVAVVALTCFGFQSAPHAKAAPKHAGPSFKDAEAIFTANCIGCHGGPRARGGIDLSTYEAVMKGGDDGVIVKASAPKHSVLVEALRGVQGVRAMPPRRPALPEASIATVENWIRAGAKP